MRSIGVASVRLYWLLIDPNKVYVETNNVVITFE